MIPPPKPPKPRVAGTRRRRKVCGCKGKPKRLQVGEEEVWTTPMVQDLVRRTSTAFESIDRDWKRAEEASRVEPAELKRWSEFYGDWKAFVKDLDDTWADFSSILAPFDARRATVQRINQYRKELNTWAKRVRVLLGDLGATSAPAPLAPAGDGARAWWSKVGQEIAIGLVVAGATAVVLTALGLRRAK